MFVLFFFFFELPETKRYIKGKSAPHLTPTPVSVAYGGSEVYHEGAFEVLRFDPDSMELVRSAYGEIPEGRTPVGGGWESDGRILYHGLGEVDGVLVPGKTAPVSLAFVSNIA